MTDFKKGIVFAVSLYLFGKSIYEKGKLDERRKCAKELAILKRATKEVVDELREEAE